MVHNEWDGEDGVKALIAQGPEPLESQFGPGYGMALNLLRTRTLPQAADFVQKSFSLYLGKLCLVRLLHGCCTLVQRAWCFAAHRMGGHIGITSSHLASCKLSG